MTTMRDLYTAIVEKNEITEEMRALAKEKIQQMDISNEHRKEKAAEKAKEKEPRIRKAADLLTDEPKTSTMIAAELTELEGEVVKVQSANHLLKKAVEYGWATVVDVKIPKVGKRKGYLAVKENE